VSRGVDKYPVSGKKYAKEILCSIITPIYLCSINYSNSKHKKMGLDDNLPEEFVDILVQNFAYDPIRLPISEDPSQVLYNRRTLETIWDTKQDAINPYTRPALPYWQCHPTDRAEATDGRIHSQQQRNPKSRASCHS
jgi:hypothetical protein